MTAQIVQNMCLHVINIYKSDLKRLNQADSDESLSIVYSSDDDTLPLEESSNEDVSQETIFGEISYKK